MNNITYAPSWINDLIVYEVATKSFTSPNGPESGTFKSLKAKLGYLHDLGITGIWLTGNSLCHPTHFYNIWTQYATIRPEELDPTLGTKEEFKAFIDTAHSLGIKVFLDVITHGVMSDSPLIAEHPNWFKGGTWGMTDYDWFGGHTDLDEWWVNTWVAYIRELGIDGFRLDVAMYRQDLWARIRKEAADMGKPIIICNENGPAYVGTCDFIQIETRVSENLGFNKEHKLLQDLPAYVHFKNKPEKMDYEVEVIYDDYTTATTSKTKSYESSRLLQDVQGVQREIKKDKLSKSAYVIHELVLVVKHIDESKTIKNIIVRNNDGKEWKLLNSASHEHKVVYTGQAPTITVYIPISLPEETYFSVQLSCHDNGWQGYNEHESPYVAQGSRFVFGYATLFAPGVPIFMAGEEYNADFVPLPKLSPDLYGGAKPGKGKWLYGSWIQWEQLEEPNKQAMLEDVKKMIRIRKQESDLIYPMKIGQNMGHLCAIDYESSDKIPTPYMYCNKNAILIIMGNPYEHKDVKVRLSLNLNHKQLWEKSELLTVEDLWNGSSRICRPDDFETLEWVIKRDKVAGGGLLVLKLCAAHKE